MKKSILALLLALLEILTVLSLAACKTNVTTPVATDKPVSMSLSDFSETLTSETPSKDPARIAVMGVAFDDAEITMRTGESKEIAARVLPADATNQKVDYLVADESIASYENGVLTAIRRGSTVLIAKTAEDGYIARLKITVYLNGEPIPTETSTPSESVEPTNTPTAPMSTPSVTPTVPTPTVPTPTVTPTPTTPAPPVAVRGIEVEYRTLEMSVGDTMKVLVRVLPDEAAEVHRGKVICGTGLQSDVDFLKLPAARAEMEPDGRTGLPDRKP